MFGKKVNHTYSPKWWWWKKREQWWSTMVVVATRSPTKQLQERTQRLVTHCCTSPWSLSSHGCPDFGPFAILPENIQVIQVAQDSEYQNMVEPSSKTHLQGINTRKNIGAKYQPQVLYTNKKTLPTHHPTNYLAISKNQTTQLKNLSKLVGFQPWVHRKEASP